MHRCRCTLVICRSIASTDHHLTKRRPHRIKSRFSPGPSARCSLSSWLSSFIQPTTDWELAHDHPNPILAEWCGRGFAPAWICSRRSDCDAARTAVCNNTSVAVASVDAIVLPPSQTPKPRIPGLSSRRSLPDALSWILRQTCS